MGNENIFFFIYTMLYKVIWGSLRYSWTVTLHALAQSEHRSAISVLHVFHGNGRAMFRLALAYYSRNES
jgi:hypothetical protein